MDGKEATANPSAGQGWLGSERGPSQMFQGECDLQSCVIAGLAHLPVHHVGKLVSVSRHVRGYP